MSNQQQQQQQVTTQTVNDVIQKNKQIDAQALALARQQQKDRFLMTGGTGASWALWCALSHLSPEALVFGGAATYVACMHGPAIMNKVRNAIPQETVDAALRLINRLRNTDQTTAQPKASEDDVQHTASIQQSIDDEGDVPPHVSAAVRSSASHIVVAPPPVKQGTQQQTSVPLRMKADGRQPVFWLTDLLKTGWRPSLAEIFIGRVDGENVFVSVDDLCHIAISGKTGGGKGSVQRMLLAQLCYLGVEVLFMNPHYRNYVVAKEGYEFNEDWTPFLGKHPATGEPYLKESPITAAQMSNIATGLDWAVKELRRRRDLGRENAIEFPPLIISLDEWPAIVAELADMYPGYKAAKKLGFLLREGRKYKVYVMLASQDFQVKTLGLDNGSERSGCFGTIFYVGGDKVTAKELLNENAGEFPENEMGKGTIGLRWLKNKARLAECPFSNNDAVCMLLGPSTYKGDIPNRPGQHIMQRAKAAAPASLPQTALDQIVDTFLHGNTNMSPEDVAAMIIALRALQQAQGSPPDDDDIPPASIAPEIPLQMLSPDPAAQHAANSASTATAVQAQTKKKTTAELPPRLRDAYRVYQPGMSSHKLAPLFKVKSHATALSYLRDLRDRGFLDSRGNKLV